MDLSGQKPTISFFCPAYYDEGNLPLLIPQVVETLGKVASEFDILVIEDGSPDRTAVVADELALCYPNIKVLHHPTNRGYGVTISEGFALANLHEWVCYTDGDCQYDIREIERFLPFLADHDAVVGFRINRALSPYRKLQTFLFNWLVGRSLGLRIRDINASFKMVRRSALDRCRLRSRSAFVDAELLVCLSRGGARIKEVPVSHLPRRFGVASGAKPHVVIATIREWLTFLWRGDLPG